MLLFASAFSPSVFVSQLTLNPSPNYSPYLSSGNNLLRHTIYFKVSLLLCKLSHGEDALWRKCGDVSRGSENLISSTASFCSYSEFCASIHIQTHCCISTLTFALPFPILFISLGHYQL